MNTFESLTSIAVDLTTAMSTKDRYRRLLVALERVIPCDAAALLRLDGELLIPVAARGLSPEALGREYARSAHPRLDIICNAEEPVRFPADNTLPDPFDGLLVTDTTALSHIHACLGCSLRVDNNLIGVLTADAFDPNAFDDIDMGFLQAVASLAGAQMQTARLIDALEQTAERHGQIATDLMQDIHTRQGAQILGGSQLMEHLRREIELVARSDFTILVLGETGVGKELVTRAIHAASNRKEGPMLYLNCAALPESLAESELFGHTQGAFTGANKERAGKFELADGGTLFLDEIGELPLSIQPKLLRALQEGEIQRVGSDKILHADVRLLVATNRDLQVEVEHGRFRADLFHRLNVYPIKVPALRERKEDIPLLSGFFCERTQRRLGLGPVRISQDAAEVLKRYNWPGNVRELENILSRAILKASQEIPQGKTIILYPIHMGLDFASYPQGMHSPESNNITTPKDDLSFREAVDSYKSMLIRRTIAKHKGNWAAAARDLGMHRSNLHNLAKRLNIRRNAI